MNVEDLAQCHLEFLAGIARQGAASPSHMPIGSDKYRPRVIGAGEFSPGGLRIFAVRISSAAYGQTPWGERYMTSDVLNGV